MDRHSFQSIKFFRLNDAVSLLQLYAIIHPDSKVSGYEFNDTNPNDLIQVFRKNQNYILFYHFLFRHLLKMKLEYLIYSVKHFVNIYERLNMLLLVDNYFWLVLERKNKYTFFVSFRILLFYVITFCSSSDLRVFTIHTQVNVHHGSYECSCWRA